MKSLENGIFRNDISINIKVMLATTSKSEIQNNRNTHHSDRMLLGMIIISDFLLIMRCFIWKLFSMTLNYDLTRLWCASNRYDKQWNSIAVLLQYAQSPRNLFLWHCLWWPWHLCVVHKNFLRCIPQSVMDRDKDKVRRFGLHNAIFNSDCKRPNHHQLYSRIFAE